MIMLSYRLLGVLFFRTKTLFLTYHNDKVGSVCEI